ncbi:MAG TPA: ABC transporter ATP-binding protein, partial [Lautropia sp.]|nr:ABC transporter ATP-binding protein [Lautropia sp.]
AASRALVVEVEQTVPMPLTGAFRCEPGELMALVGPSGAGKTSMLRVLAGLMKPSSGRVAVGEECWCDSSKGVFVPAQRRHVGLVFQNYALMPHLDALANVALSLLHLPRPERLDRARRWLEKMGLTTVQQSRRPAALSGGQQQRVAVARALAREPKLLLLDEPFSAVDQMSRQSLYRLLADLRRNLGIPIVLVTHDLNEARMLADSLVVMDAGKVLQQGSPSAIHQAPRNARVADLLGLQNRFQGRWKGPANEPGRGWLRWMTDGDSERETPLLKVRDKGRLPVDQAVSWTIPGDGIHVHAHPGGPGTFTASVAEARFLGEITLVKLALDAIPGAPVHLVLAGPQRLVISVGARLAVQLDLDLVHVMPIRARSA